MFIIIIIIIIIIYVFADDAKLFSHVLNVNDCDTLGLQGGITTLHNL